MFKIIDSKFGHLILSATKRKLTLLAFI